MKCIFRTTSFPLQLEFFSSCVDFVDDSDHPLDGLLFIKRWVVGWRGELEMVQLPVALLILLSTGTVSGRHGHGSQLPSSA